MNDFLHQFLHLLQESLPLFLLGAVLGAAIEVWMPRGWVERWLAKGKGSVFLAATAGSLLPGCAMSTMPLARALRARGVPLGTVAAFIMIAPILSPHTIVMTASLVSLPMALARIVLAFIAACALGLILNALARRGLLSAADPEPEAKPSSCCSKPEDAKPEEQLPPAWRRWMTRFLASLRELLPFLVGGLLVAAALTTFFPLNNLSPSWRTGWLAYLAVTVVAIPVYVCDGGEIPLTRALLAMGFGPGPAFCFMLAAVGTCFATIAMSGRIIGWRATSLYIAAWLVLAVGGGLLVGAMLPRVH